MVDTLKILGQISPPATTEEAIVSASKPSIVSTLFVCNTTASAVTYRLWIRKGAEDTATKQYIYYDDELQANETIAVTAGSTLAVGDILMGYGSVAGIAFTACGLDKS